MSNPIFPITVLEVANGWIVRLSDDGVSCGKQYVFNYAHGVGDFLSTLLLHGEVGGLAPEKENSKPEKKMTTKDLRAADAYSAKGCCAPSPAAPPWFPKMGAKGPVGGKSPEGPPSSPAAAPPPDGPWLEDAYDLHGQGWSLTP